MTINHVTRLTDVAEVLGVSVATVSRALTGRHGVGSDLADRIRHTAAELGYVVNLHARSLAVGTTGMIGLIVHEVGDPYFSEISSGLLQAATERHRTVQICHTGRDPNAEVDQVRNLVASRVDAIVTAGSGYVDPATDAVARHELERFVAQGGRVVAIGRHRIAVDAVLPDNRAGGRLIATHVLGLGHRAIVIMSGPRGLTTVADRLSGVHEATTKAGIDPCAIPVYEPSFNRAGGRTCVDVILREHPKTTAIIVLNDDMALGCLSGLRAAGVSVPGDISVTGFDDVAYAADLAPSLTTVRLPMAEIGAQALDLAVKPSASKPRRVKVPATLVVRDSTAAPRARTSTPGGR